MSWNKKHLLDIESLTVEEILTVLDTARASGVEVREGVRITGLLMDDGHVVGVQGESRAGETAVRARLVVGADGRRSVVARRLGLTDYGLLEAAHWKGEPMHYWADREPAARPASG